MFYFRSLCFVVFCCSFYSCSQQEANFLAPTELDLADQLIENEYSQATLQQIKVTVEDGILHFATLEDFAFAQHALINSKYSEVALWSNEIGFNSMSSTFDNWLGQLDINSVQNVGNRYEFMRDHGDGFFTENCISPSISHLISPKGYVVVEGMLNQFQYDHHLTVVGEDYDKLLLAEETMETDLEKGIFVEIYDNSNSGQRSSDKFWNCPNSGNKSLEHRIRRDRNQMVSGILLTTMTVSATNNFNEQGFRFRYMAEVYARNTRKQGFIWKKTFPDFEIQWSLDDWDMRRRSTCPGSFSSTTFFRDGLATNNRWSTVQFSADNFGSFLVDDFTFGGDFCRTGGGNSTVTYTMNSGRVRYVWTNRDTNMDIRLGCF